ncbi:hypothetical protein [Dictyobacter kobayashii]|uniref:Uncharacterized protein n=1 Tax=Dictyobacter kobayashii TaxID=2014872 RepID=A0A402AZH2_9CHLR|nr:hypothetical protein [Dictyobacter kobayashii]GCE24473.1 hypothetical protein KDK_82730 [Dictyobacter kobayashii]
MMPRSLKVFALLTFVLSILFYLFFQVSKHNPALMPINVFAEDPYDAVGSIGVQFTLFAALLSLLRAFRPYQANQQLDSQKLLLVRGAYLACLSIAVTLVADVVAMLRHLSVWVDKPAGLVLAALTAGMALLTAFVCWYIHHSALNIRLLSTQNTWVRALGLSIVDILFIVFYPEYWRQGVPGALFTAFSGILFFWILVWALGMAITPYPATFFEDCIDDLISTYRWLKTHTNHFSIFYHLWETVLAWPFMHAVLSWLNPRQHTWNIIVILSILVGLGLACMELLGEGFDPQQSERLVLVITVFVGLECIGVFLGYALLAKSLGLFRSTSNKEAPWKAP